MHHLAAQEKNRQGNSTVQSISILLMLQLHCCIRLWHRMLKPTDCMCRRYNP